MRFIWGIPKTLRIYIYVIHIIYQFARPESYFRFFHLSAHHPSTETPVLMFSACYVIQLKSGNSLACANADFRQQPGSFTSLKQLCMLFLWRMLDAGFSLSFLYLYMTDTGTGKVHVFISFLCEIILELCMCMLSAPWHFWSLRDPLPMLRQFFIGVFHPCPLQ